jgi:2-iminobutanoate/2-iminopropanoate deaminase
LIYTAGQIALDPATGQLAAGGIRQQTAQVLENLSAILEAGGSSLGRALKATVYLKDLNDFLEMNSVYETYLGKGSAAAPARTTVGVTQLPKDALVEIDLVAEV